MWSTSASSAMPARGCLPTSLMTRSAATSSSRPCAGRGTWSSPWPRRQKPGPGEEAAKGARGTLRARVRDAAEDHGRVAREDHRPEEGSDENRKVFEALVDSDILEQIRKGKWKKVEKIVKDMTGVAIDLRSTRLQTSGYRLREKEITRAAKRPGGKEVATSKVQRVRKIRPARP
ncbi:MAG: hypothetical protein MZV70_75555 [Desulfobacterales bacterium]|nr:hypothetical protein [Desulfobacterales bacterium]